MQEQLTLDSTTNICSARGLHMYRGSILLINIYSNICPENNRNQISHKGTLYSVKKLQLYICSECGDRCVKL